MNFKPIPYYKGPSYLYKKRRILWLNSSFNSGFTLIDNKVYDVFFDLPPFQIYKNSNLKVLTYIRDSNQARPIVIKLKDLNFKRNSVINTDNEYYPVIYSNHTGVEGMTFTNNPSIILIPQQIPRITLRLDDNYSKLGYLSYFSSVTNGSVFQVDGGSPDYKYIIFKSSGSFVLDKSLVCDFLIIGGGGGGGGSFAGSGGGAGGAIYKKSQLLLPGSYTIVVGIGGNGGSYNNPGTKGGDSSFNGFIAEGGGFGGSFLLSVSPGNGGCGGGQVYNNATIGTGSQGFNGGIYGTNPNPTSGGGGGMGSSGGVGTGGIGIQYDITGTNKYYSGGGGGGSDNKVVYLGGLGGGGNGGAGNTGSGTQINIDATSGEPNTGGGGGGGQGNFAKTGGNGGSGVVIIRFNEKRIEGMTANESLVQTTNSSIVVNTNSEYVINYQTPVEIPKGTYSSIFQNGSITFKPSNDKSYPILNTNPIAWYKFDTNGILIDASGNNYILTNNNNSEIDITDSIRGYASLSLNGTNQFLSRTNAFNLNNKSFSISAWLKPKDTNFNVCFNIGTVTSPSQMLHVGLYNGGVKYGFFNDDYDPSYSWSINNWYHIVWTFNTTSRLKSIYVNGSLLGSAIASGQLNTNNVVYIGYHNTDYYNGLIDDLRVYEREISPVEIYELYRGPNVDRSYPILKDTNNNTINPTAWYQFDSSLVSDSSGNGNNLTNTGVVLNGNIYAKGNGSAYFNPSSTTDGKYLTATGIDLGSKSYSISFWVYLTEAIASKEYWVFSTAFKATSNQTVMIGFLTNDKVRFSYYFNDLDYNYSFANDVNKWVHWSFIFDNVAPTGNNRFIFRNGVQVAGHRSSVLTTPNTTINIGRWDAGTNTIFYGYLDDFRIYNGVALTSTQVNELYNGRIGIYSPPSFILGLELEDE